MFRYLFYLLAVFTLIVSLYLLFNKKSGYSSDEDTLTTGKALFRKYCSSCHGLEEDGFGPPLGGITTLLPAEALTEFIRNPAKVIASGDQRAVQLHVRYKQMMPSFDWMGETEIAAILSYLHSQTVLHQIKAPSVSKDTTEGGLTGRLVAPVKKSRLQVELEEVVQIPQIAGSSPDLGIVTLRPGPAGDGTLFVGDQDGIIYRVSEGRAAIFLDVRAYIRDFQSGPGIATGVGSFDFHPDFLSNGLLYITHAETFKGQSADYSILLDSAKSEVQWILAEWKVNDVRDTVFHGTHRELLRLHAPTFAHGAQEVSFIPDLDKSHPEYGLLYFGFGDGGSNNIKHPELGHHLNSFLGTILRIDPAGTNSRNGKYGIPEDNPFVNEKDPETVREIYAYGFRNPHRMTWDRSNGNRMMVTDIGEANIEELNIVEKGGDYGWPEREGNYGIATTRDKQIVYKLARSDQELYKKPFVQYDHTDGNAISGGFVYEGVLAPLRNKYIFGDIVNGKLFFVPIDPMLSDSSIYELTITQNGAETNLREMSETNRLHLRIGYDRYAKQLFVITKVDGRIRRVSKVY